MQSAKWTGRRSAAQQAQVVLALAPEAQLAVQMLLEEQGRALSNGAPVEQGREKAIELLRILHGELGELIFLAESGKPLSSKLIKIKNLKSSALQWMIEPYGLGLGGFPLAGTSTVIGCGAALLINALTKDTSLGVAMGAAAAGVYGTSGVERLKKETRKSIE